MANRVPFSDEKTTTDNVVIFNTDVGNGIHHYYSLATLAIHDPKFTGYTPQEIMEEKQSRLEELDKISSFGVLSALEASFRVDYLLRVYNKEKDDLSRHFRDIHKEVQHRASLEENILEAWKEYFPDNKSLISELKGAFKYRHWVAHGCYWKPKLGGKYDFFSMCLLAQNITQNLPLRTE